MSVSASSAAAKSQRVEAEIPAARLECGEVDVRGDVASAGVGENVLLGLVPLVGHQGAPRETAAGGNLLGCVAVVDGQHIAALEGGGDALAFIQGVKIDLDAITIREAGRVTADVVGRRRFGGPPGRPLKAAAIRRDEQLDQCFTPAFDEMDGQSVEELVRIDNTLECFRQSPAGALDGETTGLRQRLSHLSERFAPPRAQLDDREVFGRTHLLAPPRDLLANETSKDRLELRVRVEVSFAAEVILAPHVVAVAGVIERQIHEAPEGDRSVEADLFVDQRLEGSHTGASGLSMLWGV